MNRELSTELQRMPVGFLDQHVAIAHAALVERLKTPTEAEILREVQVDAVQAVASALGQGMDAFHIAEATGLGKTAIALQLAEALVDPLEKDGHGAIVFVSPTKGILKQTQVAAERFSPGVTLTNYYEEEKDISGQIINTTYSSFGTVVEKLLERGRDVRLVIADEFHKGQGLKSVTVLNETPNAILLGLSATPDDSTIQGLIRGRHITGKERWIGMFRNGVHEVSISEGIGRGILNGLDIEVVRTPFDASNITIESSGDYNPRELQRFVENRPRTLMGVAAIAGVDKVPEVPFSQHDAEELARIHRKIAGKRTVVLCGSITHANEVRDELVKLGIAAEAYHSDVKDIEREAILGRLGTHETQVVTGVDALGIGIDLPEAEVIIYLVPRRSPTYVEQALGRVLRLAPGKGRSIAVQFLDRFQRGGQPVLVWDVLSRKFLREIRARTIGVRARRPDGTVHVEPPKVTFSGGDIHSIFEQMQFDKDVSTGLSEIEGIDDLHDALENIVNVLRSELPYASTIEFYQALADVLPSRVSAKLTDIAYTAAMSGDERGAQALLFLNMKTLLTAVHRYAEGKDEDDMMQHAVMIFLEKYRTLNRNILMSHAVHNLIEDALTEYVADRELMDVVGWVRSGWYKKIRAVADAFMTRYPSGETAPFETFIAQVREAVPEYSGSDNALINYIRAREKLQHFEEALLEEHAGTREIDVQAIQAILEDVLTDRERGVIQLRFGLVDGNAYDLLSIGRILGISRERVRQLEAVALAKLRHIQNKKN